MTETAVITDSEARRNILLLALAQALYSCTTITLFSTAGLVGLQLAPSPAYATVPITSFVLGSMFTTIPASLLMQKVGRKPVFRLGSLSAIASAALGVWAIFYASFAVFCFSAALLGVFQATSGFYRFAAVENSSPGTRHLAISWVLTGGVVAAVVGTVVANATTDLFAPYTFAGSYAAAGVLAAVNLVIVSLVRLLPPGVDHSEGPARSWPELLRQPRLVIAMLAGMVSYALMNLMMTAAPVAMIGCGYSSSDASWVIQWHVLAMYVPSFFTGQIIRFFGAERVTATGMIILIIAAAAGLAGITFMHFAVSLILLGVGWNFGFIGATTMLTQSYYASERGKVQAANDFGIALLMAVASASSGAILADLGWSSVSMAIFPPAAITLAVLVWLTMAKGSRADA